MKTVISTLKLISRAVALTLLLVSFQPVSAQEQMQVDTINTSEGDLLIYFIGHGSLMFNFNGTIVHADPSSREAEYSQLPKADLILVTHHHGDHFDRTAIEKITKQNTKIILNGKSAEEASGLNNQQILKNGDKTKFGKLKIEAVPAYNLVHMRTENTPYHPKGEGNGYVATFGDKRIYIAGDTENTPEMKNLKNIDIAFLPMNLPYTMTPEMVADGAKGFRPRVLYPYHYGNTDTSEIVELLETEKDIEVRIREM